MHVIRSVGIEFGPGPESDWIVSEDLGRQYLAYLVSRQAVETLNLSADFWQGEGVSVLQAQFGMLTSSHPSDNPAALIRCRIDMHEGVITVELEAKGEKHPISFVEAARCLVTVYGVPEGQVRFEFWLSEVATNKENTQLRRMLRLGS